MTSEFPRAKALDVDLIVLPEVDSTQRFLADHSASPDRMTVVVTENQLSGRGRLGRSWQTSPGRGLALSCQLPSTQVPHPVTAEWLQWLSLVVGASVAEAVSAEIGAEVAVKWPNDVLVEGQKVAGVLGELLPPHRVIVGVGINLSYPEGELPTPQSTSLGLHGADLNGLADRVVSSVLERLVSVLPSITSPVEPPTVAWVSSWLATLGQGVRVLGADGGELVGQAVRLDSDGSLLVVPVGSTTLHRVTVGDIEHLRHTDADGAASADGSK